MKHYGILQSVPRNKINDLRVTETLLLLAQVGGLGSLQTHPQYFTALKTLKTSGAFIKRSSESPLRYLRYNFVLKIHFLSRKWTPESIILNSLREREILCVCLFAGGGFYWPIDSSTVCHYRNTPSNARQNVISALKVGPGIKTMMTKVVEHL